MGKLFQIQINIYFWFFSITSYKLTIVLLNKELFGFIPVIRLSKFTGFVSFILLIFSLARYISFLIFFHT